MTLHEVSALQEYALLEATEETRHLPAGNILVLLEHLRTLEEKGLTRSSIFTPGKIIAGSEITFFVAPAEGKEISPREFALNKFRREVISSLLIPANLDRGADHPYKEQIDESIRYHVQEDSLAVPCLTFEDEIQTVIESVFRVTEPRTQESPAVRLLGLERTFGRPQEVYRKTLSHDKITTVVYLYHDAKFANLVAKSVQLLFERQNLVIGYRDIFKTFRDLVGAFIQRRHAEQIIRGTFRITDPVAYLHELGIPLTDKEAIDALRR